MRDEAEHVYGEAGLQRVLPSSERQLHEQRPMRVMA